MSLKKKWRTQSAPTNFKDQRRVDASDVVRTQPRRTGERVWKETTVTGERQVSEKRRLKKR